MLQNHLKIALRNLYSSRLFTTLNIVGLTGGMVAAVFILLWVQNELSFNQYHAKSGRISRIVTHLAVSRLETWHWSSTPLPLTNELRKLPEIEAVSREVNGGTLSFNLDGRKVSGPKASYVDTNWFQIFDYQFVDGSAAAFASSVRNVAMTESQAKKIFGRTDVAGKTIRIDTLDHIVSAVFKDNPANSSFQFEFLLPLSGYLANPEVYKSDNTWNNFNYQTFILLKPNTDLKKLGKKLTSIISEFKKDDDGKNSTNTKLEPEMLADMHFNKEVSSADKSSGDEKTIYVFFGLGVVIILVACINYVNLTTARASVRSKEVGVKKLLGAKHSHLFGQFMTESVLTCLAALALSTALIFVLLPVFNQVTDKTFEISFTNPVIWMILLGTTLMAILLTGIYPSLLLSSFKPFETLRGSNVLGTSSAFFRKSLVVVQFTVAIIFLISMLVVQSQMKFIREKELGYERARTFTFRLPWGMNPKIDPATIKARLLNKSSIADVTISSQSIVQIGSSTTGSYDWDGRPKDFEPTVSQIAVEDNFQKMFSLKIVDGRWFDATREGDKTNVILNETAAKKLNLRKPIIGQRFDFQGMKGNVIGIVKDFHYKSLREKIEPLVLFNNISWSLGLYVKAQPGKEAEAIKAVSKVWDQTVPNYALEYTFLDETYDRLYKNEERTATLFNTFTFTALLISCLGLFGLATFTAERRVKEIGIRKVLGASVAGIVSLLSADFITLVFISIAIASPIAYYAMNKWLQGFEYRIEVNWLIFTIAALSSIAIATLTISYQSIRAALMNPVKSLRSE
ncbi:ABC transporter permease [Dyadobacter luticola]|uniref:FtsX-like permease family protein n=1 Tax=Dyadobacter luticola TaxID=1979387 RepID=A0A5R9KXL1_9BACT|nr:ABC transporter permease [Dyadobacter luticola]TLV01003.1 FtsX-like permease family protein [Dyadobacter luticola]